MRNILDGIVLRPHHLARSSISSPPPRPPGILTQSSLHVSRARILEFLVALAGSDSFCGMSAKGTVPLRRPHAAGRGSGLQ